MNSEQLAWRIRRHGVEMTHLSGGSHIGSVLSVADILAVLYADVLKYDAKLQFAYEKNNLKGVVNLKSILNIVAAGVIQGQEIVITSEGPDEKEALAAAVAAIKNGLGEMDKDKNL